jgi:hypothetical protein
MVPTYCPDAIKLTVSEHVIESFDSNTSFILGDEEHFKIRLHWSSASIKELRGKKRQAQQVAFESGISKCGYVDGEYQTCEEKDTSLNFTGNYYINGPYFDYDTAGVFVQFTFNKQV